ncbi:crossover junction endodeoxyribonuclease RuvC [Patescibacteria group bacterium]
MTRIIGIDPGLAKIGYAVIEKSKDGEKLIEAKCIKTSKELAKGQRLKKIYNDLEKVVQKYKPEKAALEAVFFSKNAKTALLVSEVRGIILLLLEKSNIETIEPTPLQVKIALTGFGRAEKEQVRLMVAKILKISSKLEPYDVSDAAALAISISNKSRF